MTQNDNYGNNFGTNLGAQPAWLSGQLPLPQSPAPAPKKHRRWPWITLGAVVVMVVAASIAGNSGNNNTNASDSTATGSPPAAAGPVTGPATTEDDIVMVPTDLVGKTVAAAEQELSTAGIDSITLSGPQGLQSTLNSCANASADPACAQLQVSVVGQAGQQLDLTDDQQLTLTVDAIIPPGGATTIPQDGTYVVGKDIAAGTWHTDGQGPLGSCYWEKDKDLNGDFDSIIANDNVSGPTTLTISKSTVAFKVDGGCTWTKE